MYACHHRLICANDKTPAICMRVITRLYVRAYTLCALHDSFNCANDEAPAICMCDMTRWCVRLDSRDSLCLFTCIPISYLCALIWGESCMRIHMRGMTHMAHSCACSKANDEAPIHTYLHTHTCIDLRKYMYVHSCVYTCIYIISCASVCVCVCVYAYISVHTYIYIYIYLYIYMYTYMYTYMYIYA